MKAHSLGHVVFSVKDLQRSLVFYRDLLGFREGGRVFNGAAAAMISSRTQLETAQKVAELAIKKFDSIDAVVANDPSESDMRNEQFF
jgi:catechol 2,3-dioxygenase-like lactoylglutathione lyase family enzyme